MLSIVVIEYQSEDEVRDFMDSVRQMLSGMDYEVIVSSNSQYDEGKQAELTGGMPDVRWLFNSRNGGFAYGMNEGLKAARGEILVVANPDSKLLQPLKPMSDYLTEHRETGIIGPKIVDREGIIQDSFRHFFSPWGFILRQIGWIKNKGKLHEKNLQKPVNGDWVIGAFMMVRREFYEAVGGMSEDYFMYCEDMDWCKRAHLEGYEVTYFPEVMIEYKGTRSSRHKLKYAKIHVQSLVKYWRKYGWRA